MDEMRKRLIAKVHDPHLVDYFFLNLEPEEIVAKIEGLTFTKDAGTQDVPFNASVKGYHGATDQHGHHWVIKPIASDQEALFHRVTSVVFLLDFEMATLSTPTTVIRIDGKRYRASKVVPGSIQISSYNYLDQPFKTLLIGDLVNRWFHFDEDRNPNNYMVLRNSRNLPLVVAIDFDKADLQTSGMKITGTDDKFGWIRHEKNQYLTLFKTEHFDKVPIEVFHDRLTSMMAIDLDRLEPLMAGLFQGYSENPAALASQIRENLAFRRAYIDKYFRTWFHEANETTKAQETTDYSGFGATFLKIYQGKK